MPAIHISRAENERAITYRMCSKRCQSEESFCSWRCRSLYCGASNSNPSQGSSVDKLCSFLLLISAMMREMVVPVFSSVAGGVSGGLVKLSRGVVCNDCCAYMVIPSATMIGVGVEKGTADPEVRCFQSSPRNKRSSWPADRKKVYPFRLH